MMVVGDFRWMAEIAPLLANHEVDRCAEAAIRIQYRNWFLQNKVRAQLKCPLGGRTSVQNCEGNGIPVAGALAQAFQDRQSTFEIVAVYNDRVKLFRAQDFLSRADPGADFDFDRQPFQGWLENTDHLGIPGEQQRFQRHRIC